MNIYVGNLSYKVSDNDLQEVFEEFGEVSSAKVITDRETGRSKGFAFVEMENEEDAQAAIDELDGAELDGRTIKVNKARPKDSNSRGGGGNRGRYSR
jgi:RNA recognition motif-containing protein